MPLAAALFDFAGTLFMPVPSRDLLAQAAAGLGLSLNDAELGRLADAYDRAGVPGAPYPERVPDELAQAYAERDLSPEHHRRAALGLAGTIEQPDPRLPEAYYELLLGLDAWVPYTDARPMLDVLADRGVTVGLISNIGFDIRPLLRRLGFTDLAARTTLSFEVGATKPDPELFRAAVQTLEVAADQTLMVGDNPNADGGASALSMPTLLLPMTPSGGRHGLELVLGLFSR